MTKEHKFSLADLYDMIPYELEFFIMMISAKNNNSNQETEEERHAKLMKVAGF